MPTTPTGNTRLRAARQSLGLRSQTAFAEAVTQAARDIGLRVAVTARTVRRWESASPPWPHPEHAAALETLFHRPITELGFTPPGSAESDAPARTRPGAPEVPMIHAAVGSALATLPHSAAADYLAVTIG